MTKGTCLPSANQGVRTSGIQDEPGPMPTPVLSPDDIPELVAVDGTVSLDS